MNNSSSDFLALTNDPLNPSSAEKRLAFKEKRSRLLQRREAYAKRFLNVKKATDLCVLLNERFEDLEVLINQPSYNSFSIPKKSGGQRSISAPEKKLLRVQKKLNRYLQLVYLGIRPTNVHGFVLQVANSNIQANIVENAKHHVGKKSVLNIDLEDFFPSISARKVKELLMSEPFNFSEDMAIVIALLTTHKGRLPQGAPTSPVLSNFVCVSLDKAMQEWANKFQVNYSRYADDITFSSDEIFTDEQILELRVIIQSCGFRVNEKKLRQRFNNRKQSVTGITVNTKVNVDRRFLKNTRAMLHDFRVNGLEVATRNHFVTPENPYFDRKRFFLNRLEGSIAFIGQVRGLEDPLYSKMKTEFYHLIESKK